MSWTMAKRIFRPYESDDYYMSPKRAYLLLDHLMRTYNLKISDIHYMTWINPIQLDKIMNHYEELYWLKKETADAIVTLYRSIGAEDLKFFRTTNDWLEKLMYYLRHWNKEYRQKHLRWIMLSHKRKRNQKTWDIYDLLDIEKCIKEKDIFYRKEFLDRLIKTNDNYFFFWLDLANARPSESYPNWMTRGEIQKWTKIFFQHFSDFPSDLYNKYLRLSFRNRIDLNKAQCWKERSALEKIKEKWFIFCF